MEGLLVCKYSSAAHFLAGTQLCVPIKLLTLAGNPKDFKVMGNLMEKHLQLARNFLWDTLGVDQNYGIISLTSVGVPLTESM